MHASRHAGSLTNPLLDVELDRELLPFRHLIKEAADGVLANGDARHVSIYYRDLNNGPWFGLNDQEYFIPASLLKVPLMLAVYRTADERPGFMNALVLYEPTESRLVPNIASSSGLTFGESYTVERLLEAMIVDSDNHAAVHLLHIVDKKIYDSIYADLGLVIPGVRSTDDEMTVHEYATFFRILYNGAYLGRYRSEQALALLARSSFKDGLVAGVPPGIVVAHKFGERGFLDRDEKQVHDCGIVYYPGRPYVLCMMTRGTDFAKLSAALRRISAAVYAEVDRQKAKP